MNELHDIDIEAGLSDLPTLLPPVDLLPAVLYRTGLSDLCWQQESPIGPLWIAASQDGITAVDVADSAEAFVSRYRVRFGRDVRFVDSPPGKAVPVDRAIAGR